MENGEGIIGYQYLHGTNETVGDFQIRGTGIATPDGSGGYRVDFNLTFTWHDVIDPNPTYDTDTMKDAIAGVLSGGFREAYNIHISWTSTPSYTLDSSRQVVSTTGGYPRAIW